MFRRHPPDTTTSSQHGNVRHDGPWTTTRAGSGLGGQERARAATTGHVERRLEEWNAQLARERLMEAQSLGRVSQVVTVNVFLPTIFLVQRLYVCDLVTLF